jgi:hypothetical protein
MLFHKTIAVLVMRVALLSLVLLSGPAAAGTIYEVTASRGGEKVTYQVKFGGGKRFEQWTAFDPKSKTFVYLRWDRGTPEPEPVATIWDHKTGETVKLYKFPGVEHPLPVIPSLNDMKVCPVTGDKKFTNGQVIIYD